MKEFMVQQEVKSQKELEVLRGFLRSNQLPSDDIRLDNCVYFTYYNTDEALVGSGGLEIYGSKVLLRSLAVSPEVRGQQLGKQIVSDLLQKARNLSMNEVYLLTETAFYFFHKLGFEELKRDEVPEEIRSSTEFSQVCPTSAQVMKLVLK
jgi:N-acetylglutamate synthase-like GNAT family acetyltransferase